MEAMVPPHPSPKAVPHLWEYKKVKPALLESGEKVQADEAERRVLMLINPERGKNLFLFLI
jgi:gentisate 1,2-dioxygenase